MTMVWLDRYGVVSGVESPRPREEGTSMLWTSRPVSCAETARPGDNSSADEASGS